MYDDPDSIYDASLARPAPPLFWMVLSGVLGLCCLGFFVTSALETYWLLNGYTLVVPATSDKPTLGEIKFYTDQTASGEIAAIAHNANAPLRFAGQHRADLHALDTGGVNRGRQLFGDLLVDAYDHVAFVIALVFESDAAHDAVAQRLDDFARLDDRLDEYAFGSAAIGLGHDHVL